MTDLQLLFLVLGVLYFWECACWLRRGTVGFRTWFGRHWQLVHPGGLLGNQRGGFIMAHPLPPMGTLLSGSQLPLSLSPESALSFVSTSVNPGWRPPQPAILVRMEDLQEIRAEGKRLLVRRKMLLQTSSPTYACFLANQLAQLSRLPHARRETAIRQLYNQMLDTKAVEKRWQEFEKQSASLRLLINFLFGYLFVFAPFLIWRVGVSRCWLSWLLGMLACTITISVLFHRAHKHFYPEAEDERFTQSMIVLLSPVSAARAHDLLSRPLLERFHPLALAKVFCSKATFRTYAREVLREIKHPGLPLCPLTEPAAVAAEQHGRAVLTKAIEDLLSKSGLEPDALLEPPAAADETCRAYCPRCGAQFTTVEGSCPDCGGLPLVAFKYEGRSPARI